MTTAIESHEIAAAAVFAILQDATLQGLTKGRVVDDLDEDAPLPCLLYEVQGQTDRRGFGTGNLPELKIVTHAFSRDGGLVEAERINGRAVALVKDAALDLTGTSFKQAGLIVFVDTIRVADSALNGIKCHELMSTFTAWVEQS
jgi:hypothetical protein